MSDDRDPWADVGEFKDSPADPWAAVADFEETARPKSEPGNINLNNRPRVDNGDGTFSTVASKSFEIDGVEVLLPTIANDGHRMSDREAIEQYRRTGKHLGKFGSPEEADAYAEQLHNDQAQQYALPQPPTPPPWASALDLQGPEPGSGVMAPPLHTFTEDDLAQLFGPKPQEPRVSAPLSPEDEADLESKVAGFAPPLTGARDFSSGIFTDRQLGPRLSEPGQRNPLPEIESTMHMQKAPPDTRPPATYGDTFSAIPPTVAGRYALKAVGAQEMVASQDARKKYWQALVIPEAVAHVRELNSKMTDERDRINILDDPMIVQAAQHAGVRPDVFVRDAPAILAMSPDELEQFKTENQALIAEQDARLEGLAKERQDIAAELQRVRPNFGSDWSKKALLFDSLNSVIADMAPSFAVGALAGPEAGLATMGGLVLPEERANIKNQGGSDAQATFGALANAAAEVFPEGGVMEVALKTATGKQMLRGVLGRFAEGKVGHIAGVAMSEAASEDVTEAIEIGLDMGILDQSMTFAQALDRLGRAGVIGGLMGGTTGVFTAPLPEHAPHIPESAFASGEDDALPAAKTSDFADVFTGQAGAGFAAPNLPQQSDVPAEQPINTGGSPFINMAELPNVSVPAIRLGEEPATMPPPATTGSPAPGIGGSVGPTAPSTAAQGTAPERRAGAYTIEVMVQDEASQGGAAVVEATPGAHGGWTLIQPDGNVITVPAADNRPLEEIVAEYTSASKDPARVTIRKDQRPLSTAFQQSAPPAPSESTEPAPTSAPQTGQPDSPTQEPPAGGATSPPLTAGPAATMAGKAARKAARIAKQPPPAQGKLFGSEGEVVTPAPSPPPPPPPPAPNAPAAVAPAPEAPPAKPAKAAKPAEAAPAQAAPAKPAEPPGSRQINWQPYDPQRKPVPPGPIQTGSSTTLTVYRGAGKSKEEIYSGAQVPVAGEGGYYALNPDDAKQYGDNLTQGEVRLHNPLVIDNDEHWRELTKGRSGWKFPNPTGQSEATVREWGKRLKEFVQSNGYDSLIIRLAEDDRTKTLRDVFDHDQIIDYHDQRVTASQKPPAEPAAAKPEAPAPETPKAPAAEPKPLQRAEVYPKPEDPVRETVGDSDPGDVTEMPTTRDKFDEVINEFPALFEPPKKRVSLPLERHWKKKGTPFLSPEEAARRIESWQAHAEKQGKIKYPKGNSERVILSLFDLTGHWAQPYADAGYDVRTLDIQNGADVLDLSTEWFADNMPDITNVYGILIACPCTDFTVSGNQHWAAKDADGRTELSKELVFQALRTVEFWRPAMWVLENPIGRIEELTGLPPARMVFDPWHFGDPYTKRTVLWGKFDANLPTAPVDPVEGSKMHSQFGGKSQRTKNARSATPKGFASAFFMANNYLDATPAERLLSQFPEAAGAIEQALAAGFTEEQIREVVTDPYENYEYAEARDALRQLVKGATKTKAPKAEKPARKTKVPDKQQLDQADEIDRAADEAEAEGSEDEAEGLRRYADELRQGAPDELRRPKRRKSKRQPGPFSMTREGPVRAAPDTIWTDNNVDADLIENATPQRRFAKAVELLKKQFGFRDIQMDKNLPIGEAIDALKDAWIGLTNLASVQNVNPEFMSLNGRLAIQLHREYEGALAYYHPGTKTIGMTRRNDAFAHEWAHALDHWLIETFAQDIEAFDGRHLTGKTRIGGTTQTLDTQVRDALVELLNAMYFDATKAAVYVADLELKIANAKTAKQKAALQKKLDTFKAGHSKKQDIASEYYIAAKKQDSRGPEGDTEKSYWQRPTEMFARVFEAFTANKIGGLPANHPFVTQSQRMYDEGRIGTMKVPYPQALDRANIFDKLETLMKALRDRGIAPTGNAPAMIEPTDPHYWRKMLPQLPARGVQQARSVWQRMKAPFDVQKAESHRADREARARDTQDQHIRDVKLNVRGYGPSGPRRWLANQGIKLVGYIKALPAMLSFTIRGHLFSLRDMHKGNAGIAWLAKNFAHDPGANAGVQQKTYTEEIRHWEKYYQNIFAALVKKHGVRAYDNTELRELRDVLVNARTAASVAPKIKAAAADFRRFLNDMYNYNASNGVNIGYAKNGYLPRIVDRMIVEERLPEFQAQALKLYKRVYTREVGSLDHVLEDPLKHPERLKNLTQYVREIARTGRVAEAVAAAEALKDDAKQLDKLLDELKELAENGEDTDAIEAHIAYLGKKIYDGLREPWAIEAANDWEQRIRGGKVPEFAFDQRDPSTNYTKSRVLPEETDEIMGDFLKNDPLELITTYVSQSVHRVEFGKFFGNPAAASKQDGTPERKLGWKLDKALKAVHDPYTAADGSTQSVSADDYEEIEKSINLLVGRHETQMTRKALRWRTAITALITPIVLARALWSQLAEPITIARSTGNYFDIVRVFRAQLQDLLGPLIAKIGVKGPKAQAAWRREMSEYFGVVADHMADSLMLQRYNLLEMNSSDRVHMQRFFKVTGIHPHALSMRRGAVQIFMQRYAPSIAKRALGTGPRAALARQALAELGLDSKNNDLLRDLSSLPNIKTAQELDQLRYLDHIRTAINRFVDSAVLDPKAVDKPRMASMPEYSFMYGILSFQFAFQRHVLIATGKRIANAWAEDKSIGVAQGLSAVANAELLMAGQMAAYIMRTIVYSAFNPGDDDDWEHLKDKLQEKQTLPFTGITAPNWLWQSLSRAGMFGAADPLINAFMGLKYERDLSQLMAGPMIAMPLNWIQQGARAFFTGKPLTADGAYKLTEIGWKAAWMYMISKALSRAGAASGLGAFVDAIYGIGLPFMTSERVIRPVSEFGAELMTGLDYVSPAVKAGAAAGNPADMAEAAQAEVTNAAAVQPVADEDANIQEH